MRHDPSLFWHAVSYDYEEVEITRPPPRPAPTQTTSLTSSMTHDKTTPEVVDKTIHIYLVLLLPSSSFLNYTDTIINYI